MSSSPAAAPPLDVAERCRRRVIRHIMPFLFFLYILAYLDRANLSFVARELEGPAASGGLDFNSRIIGFGSGLFFWGYWILEIPSTISVLKWGARWVFVRILILWGLCCTLIGTIGLPVAAYMFGWLPTLPVGMQDETTYLGCFALFWNGLSKNPEYQFYFFRFMLGFFEGGFFPSVILYLSLWFRSADRGRAIALFMSAIPVSTLIGAPLSGLMMKIHLFDLAPWRWVFILQGIVPIGAGIATLFMLPSRPKDAAWLPDDEKEWLIAALAKEQVGREHHGHWDWLKNPLPVLLLTTVYFCFNIVSYGMSTFLPKIIHSQLPADWQTSEWATSAILGVTAFAYLLAWIAMRINGWHSDRTQERVFHVAAPLCMLSFGLFMVYMLEGNKTLQMIATVFLVGTFLYSHLPCFWPIPSMFLGTAAAASAIGFINMIGNLGGSVGPNIVGMSAPPKQAAVGSAVVGTAPSSGAVPTVVVSSGPVSTAEPSTSGAATTSAASTAAGKSLATAAPAATSYGPALLRLAPWPLVAATIIISVAHLGRKREDHQAPLPSHHGQAAAAPPPEPPQDRT